jgi:hypothetical protein
MEKCIVCQRTFIPWRKTQTHCSRKCLFISQPLKPEETVHHINGIKDDNRLENLMLFPNKSAHHSFHKHSLEAKGSF